MTATDVRDALRGRWPDDQYVVIYEAPEDAARMGRKLDVLVASCWRSRGHALDGVEIKVSYSDWKRERDNPAKADWWWAHVDRFWVAAPVKLALRIRDELPEAWGLLAVEPGKAMVVVQAPKHQREPLPWAACIGLFRASADAGLRALQWAKSQGIEEGIQRGRAAARDGAPGKELERLRADVAAAETATGIPILEWPGSDWGYADRGDLHAAVRRLLDDAKAAERSRRALEASRGQLRAALKTVEDQLAEAPA